MKKILIVDDHAVMRAGLKHLLLEFDASLQIMECGDGDSMLRHFKEYPVDILIMDIHMPDADTISLTEIVAIKYPSTYILVFSMLPDHIYGRRMLKAGAKGFLPKESSIDEIRRAFAYAIDNRPYITGRLMQLMEEQQASGQKSLDPFLQLSHREFEIVNFLLSGWSINAIAQKLNLKHSTVSTYKTRVFEKLQVATIFELKELSLLFEHKREMNN